MSTRTALRLAAGLAAGLLLLGGGGCGRGPVPQGEVAAVYEAFLEATAQDYPGMVLLEDSTIRLTAAAFADPPPAPPQEISRLWSPEVREAIADLVARSRTPVRLPPDVEVAIPQRRISPDSVRRVRERIRAEYLQRLPDRAVIVGLSAVGFSRDGGVAVVVRAEACGVLCGGSVAQAMRRHPDGWRPAEVLFSVVS
ncbi:MAG TPA: hypothetical protein VEQ60_27780 [Longimicrobium sp.]|nr:hypothetical protein [Longimicrobium sp.]